MSGINRYSPISESIAGQLKRRETLGLLIEESARPPATKHCVFLSHKSEDKTAVNRIAKYFDALRNEVMSLDDCIREEFLKLYVAYKAETNFVDVVPQAKRLRLSLNMDFPEIDDPRGLCKDVSGVGRWGNGNVEVGLEQMEDLPYIMGLIRQSLERQLGEEGEDE